MNKKTSDEFEGEEAERRLEAALRGARVTGHKEMADIPKKRDNKGGTKREKRAEEK